MRRIALVVLLVLAALVLAAGCGDDGDSETTTTTTSEVEGTVRAYFLRGGKVWPVRREGDDVQAALEDLVAGPTEQEETELEATSAIPDGLELDADAVEAGTLTISTSEELAGEALAQVVYTATQFPDVESVEVAGQAYTRSDFEDYTPSVLVESPLAFDTVSAPFVVSGTANTFEATFNYEVVDASDFIIDEDFVTATSGTGTRGTFEFTADFVLDAPGDGSLVVFEISAEDGSRMREVGIPLVLEG